MYSPTQPHVHSDELGGGGLTLKFVSVAHFLPRTLEALCWALCEMLPRQ
jgi:hypothetical protein